MVTPELVERVARRRRFVVRGVLLGLLATTVVDFWLVPVYAGLALGAVADALTRPGPPPGPRYAHATSTRLRDYVPAWLLGAATAAAAAGPLLALLWVLAPRSPGGSGPVTSGSQVAWPALAAAAGLAASLGLAGVVVRRRQPAGDADDLAVDDALRAQAVRDALHVTAVVSVVTGWMLSLALADADIAGPPRRVGGIYPVVMLLGLLVVAWGHELSGGPKHWRKRLVAA